MTRPFRRFSLIDPDPTVVREDTAARSVSFFVQALPIMIDRTLIAEMKQVSAARGDKNVRVCLHSGPDASHHDMVILEHGGGFYPPHRHPGKAETFHVIEGALGVISYDEQGGAVEAGVVAEGEVYRLAIELYHLVMPKSDIVVYHESKPGPFLGKEDLISPPWLPKSGDDAAMARLRADAEELLNRLSVEQ